MVLLKLFDAWFFLLHCYEQYTLFQKSLNQAATQFENKNTEPVMLIADIIKDLKKKN